MSIVRTQSDPELPTAKSTGLSFDDFPYLVTRLSPSLSLLPGFRFAPPHTTIGGPEAGEGVKGGVRSLMRKARPPVPATGSCGRKREVNNE
jgi:hypothetical protein